MQFKCGSNSTFILNNKLNKRKFIQIEIPLDNSPGETPQTIDGATRSFYSSQSQIKHTRPRYLRFLPLKNLFAYRNLP